MLKGDPKSEDWEALIGDPSYHNVVLLSKAKLILKCCFNFLYQLSNSTCTIVSSGYMQVHQGIEEHEYYYKIAKARDPLFYTKYLHYIDKLQQLMYNSFFNIICRLQSDKNFRIDDTIVRQRDNAINEAATWVMREQIHNNFQLPLSIEQKI